MSQQTITLLLNKAGGEANNNKEQSVWKKRGKWAE